MMWMRMYEGETWIYLGQGIFAIHYIQNRHASNGNRYGPVIAGNSYFVRIPKEQKVSLCP